MELETLKADYQKRSDQVLAIKREIAQRTRDFGQLREEVTQRQLEKEKEIDQVEANEKDLEDNKERLRQTRLDAERIESERDCNVKQYQDVSAHL